MRFKKSQPLLKTPDGPVEYPAGSFVETEAGYFYIANSAQRYRCLTKRVVDSWAPPRIIKTSEAAVRNYRRSAKLRFRNGSLIWNISDGKIYLIEDSKRRHVVSPDAFERIGVDYTKLRKYVIVVSLDEINLHQEGEPLT